VDIMFPMAIPCYSCSLDLKLDSDSLINRGVKFAFAHQSPQWLYDCRVI
jgi:hypothetical protein